MSITQRRNSQRLASTLDALSADLDFDTTEVAIETEENMAKRPTPREYWGDRVDGIDDEASIQLLGQEASEDEELEQAFDALEECTNDCGQATASILQGDPGVDEVGSQSTYDTDQVCGLGEDYGIDFDGDEYLQNSIRAIPGRAEKQAKVKRLIARIEDVADAFELQGRTALAYRLDVVCNQLEAKYFNK